MRARTGLRMPTAAALVVGTALVVAMALVVGTAGPVGGGAAAAAAPAAADPAAEVVQVRTYGYGPHGYRNEMDVYTPGSAAGQRGQALPAVVLIHGGGWLWGTKDLAKVRRQARALAGEGYVTAAINYRLADEARWPAQRSDALRAVAYLHNHPKLLNVDPDRIALVGTSAGAHVAAAAATYQAGRRRVAAVAAISGPLDARRAARSPRLDHLVRGLLRCAPAECPRRYRDATPALRLSPRDPASLLLVSRGDRTVRPRHSVTFRNAARANGLRTRLLVFDGSLHGAKLWDDAWPSLRTWLSHRLR